jgi:uncharacterized membrane protein YfcA
MDTPTLALYTLLAVVSFALAFHGAAAGLQLGQLRQPLLLYAMPTPASAAAVNLAVSGMGALAAAVGHARGGRIVWRVFGLLGAFSLAGGLLGAWLLLRTDLSWARLLIGGFLTYTAWAMLRSARQELTPAAPPSTRALAIEALACLGLGMLAAFTGLMLGSLRLPRMIQNLGMEPRQAVGTNLAVGCLTALTSASALWAQDGSPVLGTILVLAAPTVAGGLLGAAWAGRLDRASLTRLVGWTLAVVGLLMMAHGVHGITWPPG